MPKGVAPARKTEDGQAVTPFETQGTIKIQDAGVCSHGDALDTLREKSKLHSGIASNSILIKNTHLIKNIGKSLQEFTSILAMSGCWY